MTDQPGKPTKLKYRSDIDGLRAVAVLSVVAFHMQTLTSRFPGGYVGVDVFFVISGYLISSIIFFEIASAQFSIVSFYERRIRRIFPALICVLAIVSLVAYRYLFPTELIDYSKSLLAATLSGSNFYFWQQAGYFDSPLSHPLLHTWSLAVEEQFYILFPLFLVIVRRLFPDRLRSGVLVLAGASFAISAVQAHRDPTSAFYMPYTRAWELLLGTILSLRMVPPFRSALGRNIATVSGLAFILISVRWYTSATPFPGLAALLPCLGAGLIIWGGETGSSLVGKMLSLRPVVFVGLISYSLYLWHWPLIVFQSMGIIYGNGASRKTSTAVILLLSIVLAILSWRFVERPFRVGRLRLSGANLFTLAAVSSGILMIFSANALIGRGLPRRFPARAVDMAAYLDVKESTSFTRMGSCFITTRDKYSDYNPSVCLELKPEGKNYLLLGDSHSAVLWHSLAEAQPGVNIMQASASGCKPFPDLNGNSDCARLMKFIYETYLGNQKVDGIMVVARWEEADIPELAKLADWARARQIPLVLIGPTEEYDAPLPRLLAYAIANNDPDYPSKHRVSRQATLDDKLESLAKNAWHVPYISLIKAMCTAKVCVQYADQEERVPLMFDSNHYSNQGSVRVVQTLLSTGRLVY
jgi:peptidoglycan/LPS O-acetylase OafA/YrhL